MRKRKPSTKATGHLPTGRPPIGEDRVELKTKSFMADPETLDALQRLEDALPKSMRARQSIAIRQAIQNESARLRP